MAELWAEVYNFPKEGRRWASRMDKFTNGKFSTPVNPKDGYVVADCKNPRERRVLEFVVLILYPEKQTRITVTISNTIFGALSSARLVSWGIVMQEVVGKLVSRLEKGKPSSISPYLFHLYNRFECLRNKETILLVAAKVMLQFNIVPEPDIRGNLGSPKSPVRQPELGNWSVQTPFQWWNYESLLLPVELIV